MSKQSRLKSLLALLLSFSLIFSCCACSLESTENHSFSMGEFFDSVKNLFAGDQTEEKYERVKSDLEKYQTLLISYMEDNGDKCSIGGITAESVNMYLDQDTIMVVDSGSSEVTIANSKMTDPWWYNYRIEIVNNRDGGDAVGLGTDKAFIYVYSGGADKLYGDADESNDDCVLVVQYSDGEVYSRIFMPSDLETSASECSQNHYDGKYHNNATAVKQSDKASGRSQKKSGSRF